MRCALVVQLGGVLGNNLCAERHGGSVGVRGCGQYALPVAHTEART